MKLAHFIRWLLVVPVAIGAWWAVLFLGIFVYAVFTAGLDPNSNSVVLVEGLLVPFFAALSALAVVSAAVLVAPTHQRAVAWTSWVAGSAVAAFMVVDGGSLYLSTAVAVVAGAATALAWSLRLHSSMASPVRMSGDSALPERSPASARRDPE